MIKFRVYALPKPSGSKKGFVVKNKKTGKHQAIIVDACTKNKEWRSDVKDAFNNLGIKELIQGPIKLTIIFVMPRLKGHFRTNGDLKDKAPYIHVTRPDATKLLRGTDDALTGLAWKDDAQCMSKVVKIYGDKPGAYIEITEFDDNDLVYINAYVKNF